MPRRRVRNLRILEILSRVWSSNPERSPIKAAMVGRWAPDASIPRSRANTSARKNCRQASSTTASTIANVHRAQPRPKEARKSCRSRG